MPVRSMPILSRLVLVLPPALPIALCGLLLVASPAAAAQGAEDEAPSAEEIEKAGALFARSCVACHLPPAPKHATDLAWITQLTDTAWSSTPAKARAALIAYFASEPLPLPEEVSATSLTEGFGGITPSFEQGELLLTNEDGEAFRLSWTGEETGAARARALPSGAYTLRTYRIVREEKGESWHVSVTRPQIRTVTVEAGKNVDLEIDDSIHMSSRLSGDQAQMNIQGMDGAGLSIYRDGKRIPIGYRILAEDGTLLASGDMRYGWGGGGWAPVESKNGRLELAYAKPPFEVDQATRRSKH